jgi:hypothetical protein
MDGPVERHNLTGTPELFSLVKDGPVERHNLTGTPELFSP